jgi:hypothetical protein
LGFDVIHLNPPLRVKIKTRLVHDEDDRRVAVPPQFACIHEEKGALCDRQLSAHAVTGNPVTVYLT